MMAFPGGAYAAILADPPWQFRSWSDKGRNRCPDAMVRQKGLAERHYKVMGIRDIASLPVAGLALPDSALFMWVVSCNLKDGLLVGESWGFEFKTIAFVWSKTVKDGSRPAMGLGYWTRQVGRGVPAVHQRLAQALERGGQAVSSRLRGERTRRSPRRSMAGSRRCCPVRTSSFSPGLAGLVGSHGVTSWILCPKRMRRDMDLVERWLQEIYSMSTVPKQLLALRDVMRVFDKRKLSSMEGIEVMALLLASMVPQILDNDPSTNNPEDVREDLLQDLCAEVRRVPLGMKGAARAS